ncbi:MAG: hypothetical protein JO273_04265 [Methylobacteriaceae bacterium]|nr:hypothetical protein [Methylobacteriaceae bacterium]
MRSTVCMILDELKGAFPAKRNGPFSPLVNGTPRVEPLKTEQAFSDKDDWTKLDPDWLDLVPDGLGSALNFLSVEAICFYIPAYLAADLTGRLGRVDPAFYLVHGFDDMSRDREVRIWPRERLTWTAYGRMRWERLTRQQALVIVHYLEWRVACDGSDVRHGLVEALKYYWYERAAGRSLGAR